MTNALWERMRACGAPALVPVWQVQYVPLAINTLFVICGNCRRCGQLARTALVGPLGRGMIGQQLFPYCLWFIG